MKHRLLYSYFLLLTLAICFGGCFKSGVSRRGSIQGFQNGVIYTHDGGKFFIGDIPSDWKRENLSMKNIFLAHQSLQASISISSFCDNAVDDTNLDKLSSQLIYDLTNIKILSHKKIKIDNHIGLQKSLSGKFNQESIQLKTVVIKNDKCVIDLAYIAKPHDYKKGIGFFDQILKRFKTL